MKKIVIVLLLIISCLPAVVSAQLWKPDIYSVCQVVFKNGKQLQGFIEIADGSYSQFMDVHGFYYEYYRGSMKTGQTIRLSADLRTVHVHGAAFSTTDTPFLNLNIDPIKVYFFQEVTTKEFGQTNIQRGKEISQEKGAKILSRRFTEKTALKLSNHILVYETLDAIYPSGEKSLKKGLPSKVPLVLVDKVEFLEYPSEKVLNKISILEDNWVMIMKDKDIEYVPPVWLHEIARLNAGNCNTAKCKTLIPQAAKELKAAVEHANSNWR